MYILATTCKPQTFVNLVETTSSQFVNYPCKLGLLALCYPWQMAGVDLFELNNNQYLLLADYFLRYPEVGELKSTTSKVIIQHLKSLFTHHGIPEILRSDNGPQISSQEFAKFASSYL